MSGEYVRTSDRGFMKPQTTTEWGVEMCATMLGAEITKVFVWRDRVEAENDAAYRNTLSFVKWARLVSREVTTTPWEEV